MFQRSYALQRQVLRHVLWVKRSVARHSVYLSTHCWMLGVSAFGCCEVTCRLPCGCTFLFLLDVHLGAELLGHVVVVCVTLSRSHETVFPSAPVVWEGPLLPSFSPGSTGTSDPPLQWEAGPHWGCDWHFSDEHLFMCLPAPYTSSLE